MNGRLRLLGIAMVAVAAIVGLGLLVARPACACEPSLPPEFRSPMDGVVVAVDATSLTDIRGFTIRTTAGKSFDFTLGALENATQFSPSHLKEHQATSVPIRVWFAIVNGERVAYRLEDAPATPAAT